MFSRSRQILLLGLCLLGLSACGTLKETDTVDTNPAGPAADATPAADASHKTETGQNGDNNRDPLEDFNRVMYTFNDKLDVYLLKPVAKGYRAVVPTPVSKSISNFFSNLHDPMVMLNNFLQGKPGQAASDLGRFLTNSTVGIFGLFDVATKIGLPKHSEDFGQTMAVWGVGDGPYLVLPFFGSSNLRDGPSLIVDWETYPPNHMEEHSTSDKLFLVEVVDRRAQLLDASDILEQAAGQDPYVFVREAYRQRRRSQVYDGNPPQEAPDPSLFEEDTPAPKAPSKKPSRQGESQPR